MYIVHAIVDSSRLEKFSAFYLFTCSQFLASGVCTKIIMIKRSNSFKVHQRKEVYSPRTSTSTMVA